MTESLSRALIAAALLAGCASARPAPPLHADNTPGTWHVLAQGESVEELAREAGVPVEDILELNGLERPEDAKPGRLLFILSTDAPRAPDLSALRRRRERASGAGDERRSDATNERSAPPRAAEPAAAPLPHAVVARDRPAAAAGGSQLRWPIDNPVVSSLFGKRDGRAHEGIDLSVPVGTPVLAAADGEVLYAGDGIRGYGNLVVLQHPGDVLSVYAHNSELLVRQGDRVASGQRVALSGQSGRATAPHLHFELRQGQTPRDPMTLLPPLRSRP